jgi:hypothetical protein
MVTALAPIKPNELQEVELSPEGFVIPGMENVTPQELRVPVMKLVQAQSKMESADQHLGEWYNSVTSEFSKTPEVLIIGVAKGRVMFPPQYNSENKPMCGSDDGKTPREEYVGAEIEQVVKNPNTGKTQINIMVIPAACEGCPFAQWGENNEPPACSEVNTFACVFEDGLPAIFQVSRTGMKSAAALKTIVASNGIRKAVRFGAIKESNDTGVYYVPVFTPGPKPSKEWQQTALRLAKMGNFAARNQQAAAEMDYQSNGHHSADVMAPEEPSEDPMPF